MLQADYGHMVKVNLTFQDWEDLFQKTELIFLDSVGVIYLLARQELRQ